MIHLVYCSWDSLFNTWNKFTQCLAQAWEKRKPCFKKSFSANDNKVMNFSMKVQRSCKKKKLALDATIRPKLITKKMQCNSQWNDPKTTGRCCPRIRDCNEPGFLLLAAVSWCEREEQVQSSRRSSARLLLCWSGNSPNRTKHGPAKATRST